MKAIACVVFLMAVMCGCSLKVAPNVWMPELRQCDAELEFKSAEDSVVETTFNRDIPLRKSITIDIAPAIRAELVQRLDHICRGLYQRFHTTSAPRIEVEVDTIQSDYYSSTFFEDASMFTYVVANVRMTQDSVVSRHRIIGIGSAPAGSPWFVSEESVLKSVNQCVRSRGEDFERVLTGPVAGL